MISVSNNLCNYLVTGRIIVENDGVYYKIENDKVYQNVNGTWVELTDAEIIDSNTAIIIDQTKPDIDSSYDITANGELLESDNSLLTIIQSGGVPIGDFGSLLSPSIQVYCRGEDKHLTEIQINKVFEKFVRFSGFTLPEATIEYNGEDVVLSDSIRISQINSKQVPGYIGTDNQSRHVWTFNLDIYYLGGKCT